MAEKAVSAFDPKSFLATVGHGRTATKYANNAVVFPQAGPADAVFYIQKGRIKLVVESEQGKEAVVAVLGAEEFFGEGCRFIDYNGHLQVRSSLLSVVLRD